MFGKYVTGWGGKQVSYIFEGYIAGEKVITVASEIFMRIVIGHTPAYYARVPLRRVSLVDYPCVP